ncbi:MAG: U32 family peptidase, partial [Desulfobacterales bacterium]|nr:U32 family peptidase [Desulfobacterales bacterium]
MFIDNPRDNSIKQFSGVDDSSKNKKLVKEKIEYYADKEAILKNVKNKIKQLSIDKIPIIITISGKLDTPLEVSVKIVNNSVNNSFVVCSAMNLINAGRYTLNYDNLFATLKVLKNTGYHIKHFKIDDLGNDLFIPFTELTAIKKKIFSILNNSKELLNQVNVPPIKKHSKVKIKPALSILISSPEDLCLLDKTSADIFYQLPN